MTLPDDMCQALYEKYQEKCVKCEDSPCKEMIEKVLFQWFIQKEGIKQ